MSLEFTSKMCPFQPFMLPVKQIDLHGDYWVTYAYVSTHLTGKRRIHADDFDHNATFLGRIIFIFDCRAHQQHSGETRIFAGSERRSDYCEQREPAKVTVNNIWTILYIRGPHISPIWNDQSLLPNKTQYFPEKSLRFGWLVWMGKIICTQTAISFPTFSSPVKIFLISRNNIDKIWLINMWFVTSHRIFPGMRVTVCDNHLDESACRRIQQMARWHHRSCW